MFKIHDSAIFSFRYAHRLNGFFTGDKSGVIKFSELNFNSEIKEKARVNSVANEGIRGLALSPFELDLVSCHDDKNLRLWDLE